MKLIRQNYQEECPDQFLFQEQHNPQRNQIRLEAVRQHKAGGRLLEIGCGKGGFLRAAKDCFEVEGIDISPCAIKSLQPDFGQRVNLMNVEHRPLPRSQYDVVAAFNILEHLNHPPKVVKKIYEALRPGGIMVGSVPNHFGLIGSINTRLTNFFDRTHVSTYDPGTWKRIFHANGFGEVEFFGEVTFGRNRNRYLRGRFWPHLAFNLMFVCTK